MKDRLLIVGPPKSGKFTLVKSVFGSLPQNIPKDAPHQGIIHRIELSTKYFKTALDLWIDETDDLAEWCKEFGSLEAKEAREVINGIIFTFKFDDGVRKIEEMVEHMTGLIEKFQEDGGDYQWDGFVVGAGFGEQVDEDLKLEIEDLFIMNGIEMVWFEEVGKNEFGEVLGKERIRQVVECHDWEITDFKDDPVLSTEEIDGNAEMIGLLNGNDIDLDQILTKLNIAKDEISKLENDEDKHKYAKDVIDSLGI